MRPEVSPIRENAKSLLTKFKPYGICIVIMTKDQRINKAISLVGQADDILGDALRMLPKSVSCRLAADHVVDAQGQCLDAITHMQTRPLRRKKKVAKVA